ncbi:LptA/OstA family protein [Coraliomargarita algicola]|uniref:LptA/OstA family protein n=1 Tax=Coraliomargarita algicola TaxID=3092156 RepID=A0ABZ0RQE2_9BACT|nr:LptA/OstA family protein [Coraliomargarita sp. J2-16]WPJ97195.1 LptA/OstA family protein [Coraliomargarita sp. J2-16]
MTPNAPIKNFRLPRFGDNGYTQWVLQGAQGIYDSEEQVRVEGMAMRVYTGDERMALELSLDSPAATLRLHENRAYSEEAIEIVGANFNISGIGWEWSGATKEIVVKNQTVVKFTQGIAGAFVDTGASEGAVVSETEIHSERLVLRTTEEEYYFEFTGGVHVVSNDMDLHSQTLIALADAPAGKAERVATAVAPSELDSIRQIIARENVVIVQSGKTVKADEAQFYPREGRANLAGSASIVLKGAYLSGETIRSQTGEIIIEGSSSTGRSQMILTETGGLGLQGAAALTSETIVLADTITMREQPGENHFLFNGSVEVMSGAVQMRSARMMITANQSQPAKATPGEADTELKVGEVKNIVADGGVHIEQNGQIATGEKVTFFPADERAVLTGDPKVTNGEAIVTGQMMELKPKLAIIRGDEAVPVVVRLPEMPDLGYETFTPKDTTAFAEEKVEPVEMPVQEPELEATVVTSKLLRMVEESTRTVFHFSEGVRVTATNLETTCDRLDVIARESSEAGSNAPLAVERIEALDHVVIQQTVRTATAKKAIILPQEGKLVLEGEAVVEDDRGKVSGHRMTLLQGQRRAIVEGGGPEGERARITLPEMPGSK